MGLGTSRSLYVFSIHYEYIRFYVIITQTFVGSVICFGKINVYNNEY